MSDALESTIDSEFGAWIDYQRRFAGLTRAAVSEKTGIKEFRLTQIERGKAARGITRAECSELARLYGLNPTEVMARAAGNLRGDVNG